MKKLRKAAVAAVIFAMLLSLSVPAFAAQTLTNDDKNYMAAAMIYNTMGLLEDEYVGMDLTPEQLFDAAMNGMASILDPYSAYFTPSDLDSFMSDLASEYFGIGVMIEQNADGGAVISQVMSGSPAEAAGLEPGDVIVSVDGVTISAGIDGMVSQIAATNQPSEIVVTRGSQTLTLTVGKAMVSNQTVFVDTLDNVLDSAKGVSTPNLRYMYISSFGDGTADEFSAALTQMKSDGVTGLVIDLRGNGGGYVDVMLDICKMIVPKGVIMSTREKTGVATFYMSDLQQAPFKNVVILTDAYTASASETFTAAMQDSKAATVVGETTFGKGVMQTMESLPVGGAFKYTVAEVYRRSGAKINGVGVRPDVVITHPAPADGADANLVSEVKAVLNYIGCGVSSTDNTLDDAAKAALAKFQKDNGLPVTAYPDSKTLTLMNNMMYAQYYSSDAPLQKAYDILTGTN